MKRLTICLPAMCGVLLCAYAAFGKPPSPTHADEAVQWQIIQTDDRWQLLQNGQPFYIRGAVGWNRFDVLHSCGGNAVRAPARKEILDAAHQEGLAVMVNLPVRGERNEMDWGDADLVSEQKRRVLEVVRELKDHPAVMFWAVGNELDYIPGPRTHHPMLWQRLNDLAAAIRQIDDQHPIMTVVGTGRFERKIRQIAEICQDMDLLGINTYGDIGSVTDQARQYWRKPYVLAEWGPTGHWQVPKTEWGAPLEQTSSEKARIIRQRYEESIQSDTTHCLGSFVFYWSEKQETTHTWYGLFRDGLRTQSIDVMQHLWSGTWPENRVPTIERMAVEGFSNPRAVYLQPGKTYQAEVQAADPDADPLEFVWDVRPEVVIPAGSYAGSLEKRALPIDGLIQTPTGPQVAFTAPQTEGPYRIFVEIRDGKGHTAYGNVPFNVKQQ